MLLQQIQSLLGLVVGIISILAMIEIFHISSTLKKILAAIKAADARRREEFEALSSAED